MLSALELTNFGPLKEVRWDHLGTINLVIGENGSGKTFLLKALYSAMRTLEETGRGDERRQAAEILADRLYWTFQPEKLGDLVSKGSSSPLSCKIRLNGHAFKYSFGRDTTHQVTKLESSVSKRDSNSVFLPAKEVLSLYGIILKSREQDRTFGFDDTYLDLARALRLPRTRGKNYREFKDSRTRLEAIVGGRVEFDDQSGRWIFKKGNQRFPIGLTAEGVKKIAILDTLLGNRFLDTSSVIFLDEPDAALHPTAVSSFLDIVATLASSGVQFFLASHSYFVIKKLALIARASNTSIPVLSFDNGVWGDANLIDGMPDNPIIRESVDLYKQEVGLVLP